MVDYNSILRNEERAIYLLRDLYNRYGYKQIKTSKFEAYELYGRNKDFLTSDEVMTFTDSKGKLKALKPDVTLSIVKNTEDNPGEVQKFCYNDYVYRLSKKTGNFKEIMQTGVEAIGDIGSSDVCEIIVLAAKSLELVADDYALDISHMGILRGVSKALNLPEDAEESVLECIANKNTHGIANICKEYGVSEKLIKQVEALVQAHGPIDEVLSKLEKQDLNEVVSEAVEELKEIDEALKSIGVGGKIRFDFSVVNDMGYYNGVVFQGFVNGLASGILSGGRYDNLMAKMGKRSGGIGFGVYVDKIANMIEPEQDNNGEKQIVNIALPKGRLGEKIYDMFESAGYECPEIKEESRKLIFENLEKGVRYFWVKPSDVAIYVERGSADIGVAGKDIILESEPNVYELLNLKRGKCRMMVAGKKDWVDDTDKTLRVATKFPNIASQYYNSKSRDIDIVKLNGSIEIAPILGLTDVIVDIVETGNTLKANNLEAKEEIENISARLISNKASFKFKTKEIEAIKSSLNKVGEKID